MTLEYERKQIKVLEKIVKLLEKILTELGEKRIINRVLVWQ